MKPSKNRCVQFRPRERIADFDRKSSPGDGALRFGITKVKSQKLITKNGFSAQKSQLEISIAGNFSSHPEIAA